MTNISVQTKYAPQSMNEVAFNDPEAEFFLKQIALGQHPCSHLMLYGTSGNGKTCIANIIAKSLTANSGLLLEYACDEFLKIQNIDVFLQNTITFYAQNPADRCVIVFHELDKVKGSLARLWQIMDEHEDKLMVIFTTNNPTAFETPVLSRCDKYEFTQIKPVVFADRAQQILKMEGITLSKTDVIHYLTTYTGHLCDVRDYMRTIDKIISLSKFNRLPAVPAKSAKPKAILTIQR